MSKITLEPNDSGAGTFSIVSPDSNTNRTLALPDESGTILSDASTIDSNNLQSDVYKQDNILGTVSQSGGVPTGAIIERGSNSNGEFIKYADGTLICAGQYKNEGDLTSNPLTNLPSSFTDNSYRVIMTPRSNNNRSVTILLGSKTTSSFQAQTWVTHQDLNGSGQVGDYLAIGRWY